MACQISNLTSADGEFHACEASPLYYTAELQMMPRISCKLSHLSLNIDPEVVKTRSDLFSARCFAEKNNTGPFMPSELIDRVAIEILNGNSSGTVPVRRSEASLGRHSQFVACDGTGTIIARGRRRKEIANNNVFQAMAA